MNNLVRWRGSVYKLVWRELLAYLSLYYTINLVYRYALNEDQKRVFEKVHKYFGTQTETIPMSFVLGFYVSLVVKRWWDQFRLLPWPDSLAMLISAAISGNEEISRLMRRNIVRYEMLAYVVTLQRISLSVRRRFPSLQHLVDSGLMLESEKKIFEVMDTKGQMAKYFIPLVWATNIINRARKEGLIASDHIVQTVLTELSDIRFRLGALQGFDTFCVPLVYTQVATLAIYIYFISALMGRQMVSQAPVTGGSKYEDPDLYFPLFTALQFFFYVGWLKVAEVLINPWGEDDDDIELNWLIDRHIKAAYMIVDEMHEEHPELCKDQYWEEVVPKDLPYTAASEIYRRAEPKGSAEMYKIKEADGLYANISSGKRRLNDDVYADYESVDTPMVERRKNWLSRQMNRMGSIRSLSTAYSSGRLFNRNRVNSAVYSQPESGLATSNQPPSNNLLSKFRKSGRQRPFMKQTQSKNSFVPLNLTSANAQFGSLVIPTSTNQDPDAKATNSYVVTNSTGIIPVSITTAPFTISASSTNLTTSPPIGPVITELPLDLPSSPATPHLGSFFIESQDEAPIFRQKRRQSADSIHSGIADNSSNVSASTTSTLSKRQSGAGGKKNSEVYV
ncbi:CLUMA_CG015905, isoform B [Clunio marinus]|uniref:Bestrophin homolog n=1 Tax=Clunio marinus TaxID=568069 RepID=A0A1J1IST6_9DIPT|nr:CLUMA_CG015905, isoform B [Clunio marinus]